MELSRVIKERCSTRRFEDRKPGREQLTAILEAGRLAPSWVNVQPWHFIVVDEPETIALLGKLSFDQPHVLKAPALILGCGTLDSWEIENYRKIALTRPNIAPEKVDFLVNSPIFSPKLLGKEAVIYRTLEELTYAIAYMTLEIENQGLAGCIIGAMGNPLVKTNSELYEEVSKKLNLPENTWIMTMLVVGYSAEEKTAKVRKDFKDIVSYNTFGTPY